MKMALGALVAAAALAAQSPGIAPDRIDRLAQERELRAAVQEDPADHVARYNLGTLLVLDGRYDEARPYLETVRLDEPRDVAAAHYNLGATDLEPAFADSTLPERPERLRRAIEAYKRALLADPADEDAKWNLELARRLLERDPPPAADGGGGGGGGGGQGLPIDGSGDPSPTPAVGGDSQPEISETQAERLLDSAQERELDVQRDRLAKPQPPGPIRP